MKIRFLGFAAPVLLLISISAAANSDHDRRLTVMTYNIYQVNVRLTDRTAILARTDLPASELKLSNVQQQDFQTNTVFLSWDNPSSCWAAVHSGNPGYTCCQ